MLVLAKSYWIGLPFALIGLGIMLASKPLGDFYAGMERGQARFVERLPKPIGPALGSYFRRGTKDTRLSKLYRYGTVFVVGLMLFVAGVLSVAGVYNPYE